MIPLSYIIWDTIFAFPIYIILYYIQLVLSISILIIPIIYLVVVKPKAFRDNAVLFQFLKQFPFGKFFFSHLIGFYAPYTASICPFVEEFNFNSSIISIQNYPWLRNPFQSVHAIALANLGELSSGIVMHSLLLQSKKFRGIPIEIKTEYYRKGRGKLFGSCQGIDIDKISEPCNVNVVSEIKDSKNNLICKTTVVWTLSYR